MSIDYYFNKRISIQDIKEKTKINVEIKDNYRFLTDNYDNYLKTDTEMDIDYIKGITAYGTNNPLSILDEFVGTFQIDFITDNETFKLAYEPDIPIKELVDGVMDRYGYIKQGDIFIVPNRTTQPVEVKMAGKILNTIINDVI